MEFVENYLEPILREHFQKNVTFLVDDLELKSGKFILYRMSIYGNNYYVDFNIQTNKKMDSFKIPYPFAIEDYPEDNLLYFDYRLKSLCKNNNNLINKIQNVAKLQEDIELNKFYDKILEIKFS